jgi:hypothetical protein
MLLEIGDATQLSAGALRRIAADDFLSEDERARAAAAVRADAAEAVAYLVEPADLVDEVPGVDLARSSWTSERFLLLPEDFDAMAEGALDDEDVFEEAAEDDDVLDEVLGDDDVLDEDGEFEDEDDEGLLGDDDVLDDDGVLMEDDDPESTFDADGGTAGNGRRPGPEGGR